MVQTNTDNNIERLKLKLFLEELKKIRGRGTELITYYVPSNYDLSKLLDHLSYEYSTAQNIKDDTTRKNVMDALAKIINYLKGFKKIPKNGLVIFCGNVSQTPGKQDIRLWVIEPLEPLNIRLYRCGNQFIVDPLLDMLEEQKVYGLIVLDRGEMCIGLLKGKRIIVLESRESWVPGKHRAGGQSALRFQRIIEQEAHNWLKYIGEKARKYFDKYKENLKGIIVGGPGPFKREFVEEDYLPYYLKNKIIAVIDTGYANEYGLKELVEKAKKYLEQEEIIREKKLVEKFFRMLINNPEMVVYGEEETKKALEYGAVDILLISEDFDKNKLKEYIELAEQYGTKVEVISLSTSEGEQFKNFKIAGILRYKIY